MVRDDRVGGTCAPIPHAPCTLYRVLSRSRGVHYVSPFRLAVSHRDLEQRTARTHHVCDIVGSESVKMQIGIQSETMAR